MPLPILMSPPVPRDRRRRTSCWCCRRRWSSVAEPSVTLPSPASEPMVWLKLVQESQRAAAGGHRERAGCRKRHWRRPPAACRTLIVVSRRYSCCCPTSVIVPAPVLVRPPVPESGGGERDVVAVGVEGRPAGAEGGQLDGDVGAVAGRPLQAAAVDRDEARAEAVRRIEVDEAAGDGGAAGIGVVAGQDQRAHAGLAQRAGAGNVGGEGERVGEVRDDLAVVDDRRRDDRAGEPAGAEIERAAGENPGVAARVDHAAVGDGERSDQGPQPQPPSPMESPTLRSGREPAPVTSTRDEPSITVADEGDVGVDARRRRKSSASRVPRWCRRRPRGRTRRYSRCDPGAGHRRPSRGRRRRN